MRLAGVRRPAHLHMANVTWWGADRWVGSPPRAHYGCQLAVTEGSQASLIRSELAILASGEA